MPEKEVHRLPTSKRPWLFDELRSRYEHPLEVAAYTRQIDEGLLAEEQAIIQHVFPQPCRTLVLGCGAGREVFALIDRGYKVTGADISNGMLRAAQRAERKRRTTSSPPSPPAHWVWMEDPVRLPLPDASYNLVIAFAQILSHIPNHETRISFLTEIKRVLKPGGKMIATFTDRGEGAQFLAENGENGPRSSQANDNEESNDPSSDDFLSALETGAGWEDGDLLIWHPSEANLDEPLFFHLHTRDEITQELEAAGLGTIHFFKPHELTPKAAPDGHLYPFVVAERGPERGSPMISYLNSPPDHPAR